MASRYEALEDSKERVVEDTVFVALGKDVKECRPTLMWSLGNSGGKRICILHVHQPAQRIPGGMGAFVPASSLQENVVREHRETERQKMHALLDKYLQICRQNGVKAQKLYIETDSIEKGIVELISRHRIRQLVMGATAEKDHPKKMMEIRISKVKYVREQAPVYCQVQFICKGHLTFTSTAGQLNSTQSLGRCLNPILMQGPYQNREASAETETGQSSHLKSQSFPLEGNMVSTATGPPNYSSAPSVTLGHDVYSNGRSIYDIPFPEGTEEGNSDTWDALSKTTSCPSSSSTSSPNRVVGFTLNERHKNGVELNPFSPALDYSGNSSTVQVISSSMQMNPSFLSGASDTSRCSSYDRSLDNSLFDQLQQAMEEAEKETLRRQKAEKDMIEARRRIKLKSPKAQEEMVQRKEIEETLAKERQEVEKVKTQRDRLRVELQDYEERQIAFKSQLEKLQKEWDELQIEHDNALKEVEALRSRQMPQFSEFSRAEIEEATQNFDESQKIGQGGYGSIYQGLLLQTKVAIKRLESNGEQGISEFQMEVRVLSRLSHPNLVRLLGFCPEVYALIYEYVPNGSLEDRLRCRNNSPPLSWETRTRIAMELCSVLVYLHNNKPDSIVHGDLKPSNILLDANFFSKLSDFGICRMLRRDRNSRNDTTLSHITIPKGTLPYIDPESAFSIANEVKYAVDTGNLKALLDPLAGDWPIDLAQKLALLGLRCCDRNRMSRPDLGSDVLKGTEFLPTSGWESQRFSAI
ncbi:U-box domain-containing protein 32 [Morella rubra]|uniref:RING-type E3 ubiquitin transferase n=1 Tax=Morella rubra TaxID=262757 RepID=A0A6A1VN95_9ROSI|nr:U-box domain-containing protein 32 [Morella rubra]